MTPLMIVHVSAGSIALFSGVVAVFVRKGARLHRAFGTVFFVSMLIMAATASYVAFLVHRQSMIVAGILTLYLVATAWTTVRRKEPSVGLFDYGALAAVLGCVVAYLVLGRQAMNSPKGALDGFPAAMFFGTACIALLPAVLDLNVIRAGGISGAARIARHLWRMCMALFFAAGSFFTNGLPRVLPASMHGSPILLVPILVPLALMVFWLIRVRLTNWYKNDAMAA
jgi:hypothetical protein